jgi:hypothetical protein
MIWGAAARGSIPEAEGSPGPRAQRLAAKPRRPAWVMLKLLAFEKALQVFFFPTCRPWCESRDRIIVHSFLPSLVAVSLLFWSKKDHDSRSESLEIRTLLHLHCCNHRSSHWHGKAADWDSSPSPRAPPGRGWAAGGPGRAAMAP